MLHDRFHLTDRTATVYRVRALFAFVTVAFLLAGLPVRRAQAAAGDLDPAFGVGGCEEARQHDHLAGLGARPPAHRDGGYSHA